MNVALAQFGAGPDKTANVARAVELLDVAVRDHQADLVVLPEFFNTNYFPQYSSPRQHWDLAEDVNGPSLGAIVAEAKRLNVHVIATMYEETAPGRHYDTAFVIDPAGGILGCYRKTHAPLVESGYEKLYYTQGSEYPVFDINGWRCGITICYDWRFPEAARSVAVKGADVIVMPFAARATPMWCEALATRAWENQVYVLVCNKAGQDDQWLFSGTSLVIDPSGTIVARAGDAEEVIGARLDREAVRSARARDFNWRDRRPEIYRALTAPSEAAWS